MTQFANEPRPRTLAIILARAGSKGLPGKNTMPIAGRPCIEWTIEHALRSTRVDAVVVTTDDEHAGAIATRMGVDVIERPCELASDSATVDDAARHAVDALHDGANAVRPDFCVILYANVPVRPCDLTDRACERLVTTRADSVVSVAPVGKHHPWWTLRVSDEDGTLAAWEGEKLFHNTYRRQMLPPAFVPDGGALALTTRALFLEVPNVTPGPHAFLGRDRRAVISPEGAVIDIDARIDAHVADAVLREARLSADHAGADGASTTGADLEIGMGPHSRFCRAENGAKAARVHA
jgi:CMP-N,N'-diacetyllegionaminic acid synthase